MIKKYPSLKKEIQWLVSKLEQDPVKGVSIGQNCFKIRLAIASKRKGKSGGARVITHLMYKKNTIYLLSIYDKSDMENLTDKEIMIPNSF